MANSKTSHTKKTPSLRGDWKVIGCQLNTRWLAPAIFEHFIYRFPDDSHFKLLGGELTYPTYMGGFPKSEGGTISINAAAAPYTIDLTPGSGPFAGQTFLGIFELDHDILKANFAFPNHERPKFFSASQGEVYEIWQRLA